MPVSSVRPPAAAYKVRIGIEPIPESDMPRVMEMGPGFDIRFGGYAGEADLDDGDGRLRRHSLITVERRDTRTDVPVGGSVMLYVPSDERGIFDILLRTSGMSIVRYVEREVGRRVDEARAESAAREETARKSGYHDGHSAGFESGWKAGLDELMSEIRKARPWWLRGAERAVSGVRKGGGHA